jgi:hypothetical protein
MIESISSLPSVIRIDHSELCYIILFNTVHPFRVKQIMPTWFDHQSIIPFESPHAGTGSALHARGPISYTLIYSMDTGSTIYLSVVSATHWQSNNSTETTLEKKKCTGYSTC